jgi:hypothetical protein
MDKKDERALFIRLIKKSPFGGLVVHADKACKCVSILKEEIEAYCDQDWKKFEMLEAEIFKLEEEGDAIKRDIRNHLPKSIWMPVDKTIFLACLHQQEEILGLAKDTGIWLKFRRTEIPKELRDDLIQLLIKTVECIGLYENAVSKVKNLVAGLLKGKERKAVRETLKQTHREEFEADEIERRIYKNIFNLNLQPVEVFYLLKLFDLVASIPDRAEDAGDWLRVMTSK